jgi:hypothetical protein
MRIKFILFNILLIIFLFMLIYLFLYVNYNNYEKFETNAENVVSATTSRDGNSDGLQDGLQVDINTIEKIYDGSTPETAFKSAEEIICFNNSLSKSNTNFNKFTDNYYWINLPVIGPQYIYCILDENYFNGGWMLALRAVKGSRTFHFNSPHWTTNSTLNANFNYMKDIGIINQEHVKDNSENYYNNDNIQNYDFNISSIGEEIYKFNNNKNLQNFINKYDAKFNTFNYYKAKEWMAIFYNKDNTGRKIIGGDFPPDKDISNNNKGWIWYEPNIATNNNKNIEIPILKVFQMLEISKRNINLYETFYNNEAKKPSEMYKMNNNKNNKKIWYFENSNQFYGINFKKYYDDEEEEYNSPGYSVRWGINTNDNTFSGIGLEFRKSRGGNSAGDFINNKLQNTASLIEGLNDSIAFEWYVR